MMNIEQVGPVGAVITGMDLRAFDEISINEIKEAFLKHSVLVFKNQELSPKDLRNVSLIWGEPLTHPVFKGMENYPEIIEIVKESGERNRFGDYWHTDQIFTPEPAMATMLYAKEVPPVGGDTMFASLTEAYAAMSHGMKAMASQLKTFNQYDKQSQRSKRMAEKIPDQDKPADPATHPLVRIHPETEKPALYINGMPTTTHFVNMTKEESQPLIQHLLKHATRPEFTCRIRWEPGTLGMWDNRCLLHMALDDYPDYRRGMHRITIKGDATIGIHDFVAAE